MNFQSLMQKYRYFNSKNDTNIKVNTHVHLDPVKYILPIINVKENKNKKELSLTKILNIDTNLDYDYEKQVIEEKAAEQISYSNPKPISYSNTKPISYSNPKPKNKYITLFFIFGIFVFPIYKYLYIYK